MVFVWNSGKAGYTDGTDGDWSWNNAQQDGIGRMSSDGIGRVLKNRKGCWPTNIDNRHFSTCVQSTKNVILIIVIGLKKTYLEWRSNGS